MIRSWNLIQAQFWILSMYFIPSPSESHIDFTNKRPHQNIFPLSNSFLEVMENEECIEFDESFLKTSVSPASTNFAIVVFMWRSFILNKHNFP